MAAYLSSHEMYVVVKALCAGSRPDEVNEFFSIYLILPAALSPGVHAESNRIIEK
jgi:hypothetical protein